MEECRLSIYTTRQSLPVSSAALAHFLGQDNHGQIKVHIERIDFSEDQCLALATGAGENCALELDNCALHDEGAALVEAFRANQGPTSLCLYSHIPVSDENFVAFANTLPQNTSLKFLSFYDITLSDSQWQWLATGLSENQGIEELVSLGVGMSDESWQQVMHSIRHHQSLKTLNLLSFLNSRLLPVRSRVIRARQVVQMLQTNTVLSNFLVDNKVVERTAMEQEIKTRLLINGCRPRVQAIRKEPNSHLRSHVFTRALDKVNDNPTVVFKFVMENRDLCCLALEPAAETLIASASE